MSNGIMMMYSLYFGYFLEYVIGFIPSYEPLYCLGIFTAIFLVASIAVLSIREDLKRENLID
jgi:hypothetical protein